MSTFHTLQFSEREIRTPDARRPSSRGTVRMITLTRYGQEASPSSLPRLQDASLLSCRARREEHKLGVDDVVPRLGDLQLQLRAESGRNAHDEVLPQHLRPP